MRIVSGRIGATFAGLFAAFFAQAAVAETIPVRGVYAARTTVPPNIQLILVDRMGGDLGQDLELELTDVLGRVVIREERYFDLITPRALRDAAVEVEQSDGTILYDRIVPDAELRGTVRSEIIERQLDPKIERECVKRDDEDNCIERRETRIECAEIEVHVDPRIVLTSADGRQIYSYDITAIDEERFCADQSSIPSALQMADGLVNRIAMEIRRDLAPMESARDIRVMESRRDLRREDRRPFREAVRATDNDVAAACAGFRALEATNPDHVSVLFNIGLCHESESELDLAADYYSRALVIDPGRDYPVAGKLRIESRQRAEAELAEREEIIGSAR